MNTTPRLLNRITLLVAGIVALALGVTAVAVATLSGFAHDWTEEASPARTALRRLAAATSMGAGGHSWLWLVALGICAIGIVLAVALMLHQGRGRTRTLLRRRPPDAGDATVPGPRGEVVIEARVAEQAIVAALAGHPQLLSVHATTQLIRGARGLKITVAGRRGLSPSRTVEVIERTVRAWDTALGEEVPVLIELVAGIRARTGNASRVA